MDITVSSPRQSSLLPQEALESDVAATNAEKMNTASTKTMLAQWTSSVSF